MQSAPSVAGSHVGVWPENRSGLPDELKAGIECLSGLAMDDVRVHYNSAKPAQLQALAYTQGTDIYMGPGQERHLPHEIWHVVQQKQGRVNPTMQMKGKISVNDDEGLEKEATEMGAKAHEKMRFGSRSSGKDPDLNLLSSIRDINHFFAQRLNGKQN